MNYKNNLSLILASTMVSGMFSAAVNAKAYNFTTKDGNLEAYAVSTEDGKNVIKSEGSANIELALSATGTKSQKVAFGVSSTFSDDASGGLKAVGDDVVKGLKDRATEVITALNTAAQQNAIAAVDANATAYAKAFRDAVEIMAKIKGKMSGASNAQELVPTVKKLVLAFTKAYAKATNGQAAITNETFVSSVLPAGLEDPETTDARVVRALIHTAGGAGAQAATDPTMLGICVGDVLTDLSENDEKKYQVLGSQAADISAWDLRNDTNGLHMDHVVRVGDDMLVARGNPGPAGLITLGVAAVITGNVAAGNGGQGAIHNNNAFLSHRKVNGGSVTADNLAQTKTIIAQNVTDVAQLQNFNIWMNEYFMYRAKEFLKTTEGMDSGAEAATWLGAGAVKTSNLNKAEDYKVTIANGKNLDAISVKKVVDDKVALGAANGATVSPLMVEFVAGTPAKEKTATGTLKISADGMKKAQEIEFSVTVGSVAKTDTVDVDTSAEQTVPSGYTFTKTTVAAIRNAEADDFVINVLPNGTKVEAPVTMTIAKTKQIRTGERKIVAEISEDENANELYAPEENGKKKNDIAILNASKVSDGKVEYSIPVEVAKEELGELENGAKVYVYLTTTEKLEATKEKKAAAKKAEAKASANDGAVDSTRMIEGKVVDGKITFTEDPSKISREEDEVFMMSKNKLDIKDAEEASAEEDKEEEEDEEEAEDEEEEEDKAEEEKAEGEEAATEGAAGAATAGNDALTTEGTVVDEVTANEVPASTEEVSANAANGVAATGATAAAGLFGTMALASLAAGALATKKNKK